MWRWARRTGRHARTGLRTPITTSSSCRCCSMLLVTFALITRKADIRLRGHVLDVRRDADLPCRPLHPHRSATSSLIGAMTSSDAASLRCGSCGVWRLAHPVDRLRVARCARCAQNDLTPDDTRRPPLRRHRGSGRHRGPPPSGDGGSQGLGRCRTASPARRTAPPSPASSTTLCAARPPPPGSWARRRRGRSLLGMLVLQRGMTSRRSPHCSRASASRPSRSTARSGRRIEGADLSTAPRPTLRAISRNGSSRPCGASSATISCRNCRRLTGRAPLDLRVNALKVQSRAEAHDALPHLGAVETPLSPLWPADPAGRGRARPGRAVGAGIHQGLDRDPGRRLSTRCDFVRRPSRASRWSTSAPAAAARRWRSRR